MHIVWVVHEQVIPSALDIGDHHTAEVNNIHVHAYNSSI